MSIVSPSAIMLEQGTRQPSRSQIREALSQPRGRQLEVKPMQPECAVLTSLFREQHDIGREAEHAELIKHLACGGVVGFLRIISDHDEIL